MKELAEQIAKAIFDKMEPELHKAMVEKIIAAALEKWKFRVTGDDEINRMLEIGIEKAIAEKYKPVLDYIADQKARAKVMRRAEQNGIPESEILPLFTEILGETE